MRLMRLDNSEQEADIRSGKAPSDVYGGIGRVKTYVKLQDVNGCFDSPRVLEFDQPYQVAADALGCTWNETNPVFVIELAGCNLKCPYCFIGDYTTVDVDVETVISVWMNYRLDGNPSKVFRISGGEPMMQENAVSDLVSVLGKSQDPKNPHTYIWVDTNLTLLPSTDTLSVLSQTPHLSVCGCFKPLSGLLSEQLSNAKAYIDAGVDMFFYWPTALTDRDVEASLSLDSNAPHLHSYDNKSTVWRRAAASACEIIANEVHPLAPLRTTFIRIKYHYNVVVNRMGLSEEDVDNVDMVAQMKWRVMQDAHLEYLSHKYDPKIWWLPSHKVELNGAQT